jgi:hypothetical protein
MAGKNRKGRKRKTVARRHPGGQVVRASVDVRGVVLAQPHRIRFPEAHRGDQRAESYLGSLNLEYRIHESKNANQRHPVKRLHGITDDEYLAGEQYARCVARYLAMCNAPKLAQQRPVTSEDQPWRHAMRKPSPVQEAMWRLNHEADDEVITERYMRAYEAVSESAGHKGHIAINAAVIRGHAIAPDQVIHLRAALRGLVVFFGIGGR